MIQLADQTSFHDSHRGVSLRTMALAISAQIELRIVTLVSLRYMYQKSSARPQLFIRGT